MSQKKICPHCNKPGEFHKGTPWCKSCKAEYDREYRLKNQNKKRIMDRQKGKYRTRILQDYKQEIGCEVCGYNEKPDFLGFHHVDPASKKFEIGETRNASWNTLEDEIAKCVVLCRSCHSKIHIGPGKKETMSVESLERKVYHL